MSSPMGADHTAACVIPGRTGFDSTKEYDLLKPNGQEELSLDLQTMVAVMDWMGVCFFIGLGTDTLHTLVDLHRAKYGSSVSFEDLVCQGRRILNWERRFNVGAGIAPVHHLPDFFEEEPLPPHNTVFDISTGKVLEAVRKHSRIPTTKS